MIKKAFFGALAIGMFAASCSSDDDSTPAMADLNVSFNQLENLGANFVYEGWIIVNGSPVSTGTFMIDDAGALSKSTFSVDKTKLDAATAFVLSIEPANDPDPAPAPTKVLRGTFSGNSASVSSEIVGDFTGATGSFFLRTPTDETAGNNMNDQYGVWFGAPGMPPTANTAFPDLPTDGGWAYEGWVVVSGVGPISTGIFYKFGAADEAKPFSGVNPGPPVPGEDFFNDPPMGVTFPLDVRGKTIVVSIEPVPDNDVKPFSMKPLKGTAGTATAPTSHNFTADLATLPTGTITRQ